MNNQIREFGDANIPSADVSFGCTQDRATFGSKIRDFYERRVRLLTIFALACILSVSGVLIAKISTDYGVNRQEQIAVDDYVAPFDMSFEDLAYKYINLFGVNDKGQAELRVDDRLKNSNIDTSDMEQLQAYSDFINVVNGLIDSGELAYDEALGTAGVKLDKQARDVTGGKSDFYIRYQKVLFVNIPIGYFLSLGTLGAISLGLISMGLKLFLGSLLPSTLDGFKDKFEAAGRSVITSFAYNQFLSSVGLTILQLYQTMKVISNIDLAVDAILAASTGGLGSIIKIAIKVVAAILSAYFYDRVGSPFLSKGAANILNSNNTVEMKADLLLIGREFRQYRW